MNSDSKPMPATEFRRWLTDMGTVDEKGNIEPMSERDASRVLGMSRGFVRTCISEGAPLYVAYACTAALKRLAPYGIGETAYWKEFKKQLAQ